MFENCGHSKPFDYSEILWEHNYSFDASPWKQWSSHAFLTKELTSLWVCFPCHSLKFCRSLFDLTYSPSQFLSLGKSMKHLWIYSARGHLAAKEVSRTEEDEKPSEDWALEWAPRPLISDQMEVNDNEWLGALVTIHPENPLRYATKPTEDHNGRLLDHLDSCPSDWFLDSVT